MDAEVIAIAEVANTFCTAPVYAPTLSASGNDVSRSAISPNRTASMGAQSIRGELRLKVEVVSAGNEGKKS